MAPTVAAASSANDRAVMRLKTACYNLERLLPPPDNMEADETTASEIPTTRPRPRQSSIASCAQCAIDIENLPVGDRAGHLCTHQQGEGGGDADDENSLAGSGSGQARPTGVRGGKKRQADAGVVREYMSKMDERMDSFVQSVATLVGVVDQETGDAHEEHLMEWSNYCEGLKDRGRDVIAIVEAAQQVETDREFAVELARRQLNGGAGRTETSPTPSNIADQATCPPPTSGVDIAVSASISVSPPQQSSQSSSAGTTTTPSILPPVVTPAGAGGGLGQTYNNTNLELAVKAMNNIAKSIDLDILTVDQEIQSLDGVITDSHAGDLREYCARIEEKTSGDYVRAGEKLARLDLDRRTNVLDTLDGIVEAKLAKVRDILARLRRLRSGGSSTSSQQRSSSVTSGGSTSQSYKPYLERLKPPIFSGKVEDWPEFRSVWKDMLSSYPESVQVQHIKNNIPTSDARRVAGVKTMEEIWKRLEKVYGDTQLNILTVKANLENLTPKATEN